MLDIKVRESKTVFNELYDGLRACLFDDMSCDTIHINFIEVLEEFGTTFCEELDANVFWHRASFIKRACCDLNM